MPTINGTTGNDTLTGTSEDDVIGALAGDDLINALDGNDTVFAGVGNDTVYGGGGNDYVVAAEGDDIVYGEDGDDILIGGLGNDIVDGGGGNDSFVVRNDYFAGSDFYSGDQFIGGAGTDTIIFNGDYTYGFLGFDLTATTISGIEILRADLPVFLTVGQLAQFTSLQGIIRVSGSGTIDLSGERFLGGTIYLGSGNDIVTMAGSYQSNFSSLSGGGGDDQLTGSETANSLDGGDGNDTLDGRAGADTLAGGAGNDISVGGDGDDTFYDGFGDDVMDGGVGNDTFFLDLQGGFSAADQIVGGSGYDTVYITQSPYVTEWLTLGQLSGIERLSGGNARFTMSVTEASQFDLLEIGGLQLSTAGVLTIGSNIRVYDFVLSNFGNTIDLSASTNGSRVVGGGGNDVVTGSALNDVLTGGGGNDILRGGGSYDELTGGDGVDWLDGGAGDDMLFVAIGETVSAGDRFTGGSGIDTLWVGVNPYDGNTIADLSIATIDSDVENLQASQIRLTIAQLDSFTTVSANRIHVANAGALDFAGQQVSAYYLYLSDAGNTVNLAGASFYEVQGGIGNDTIVGTNLVDRLLGGAGNDSLTGGGGDDFLIGQAGADVMSGGAGNDWFDVDNAGDVIVEAAGEGIDFIYSAIGFVVPVNVENLSLYGEASVNVTGNALDNRLTGNSGNNLLDGAAGADVMIGGNGNDTYVVDNVGDLVDEAGYSGTDTILSSIDLTLSVWVENLTLTGTGAINGTGGAFNNLIIGNSAANIIDGAGGADIMQGGGGDDLYFVDQDADKVIEDANSGTDLVISGANFTLGANVEQLTLLGAGDTNGAGNAQGNVIRGNDGINVLLGFGGDDLMYGGNGNDTIEGGDGADILRGEAGDDRIVGGAGADWIVGGLGNDNLSGGADADTFYLGSPLGGNVDAITDLSSVDIIYLDKGIFAALADGALSASAFRVGTAATTSAHRIIYNSTTQQLFYDADGSGAGAAVLFATLSVGTTATAANFFVGMPTPITVESAVTYALGAGEQNLMLLGSNAVGGTGNGLDNLITGNYSANVLSGAGGVDTLTGRLGADTLTGGAGADVFRDTTSGLSGDTITDLALGDTIVITDASIAGFTFSLTGSTLTFTGGSLTLTGGLAGALVASAASGGGVQLTLQASAAVADVRNDFNGDGRSDILWRNVDGQLSNWLGQANGGFVPNNANAAAVVPVAWRVVGTGDFNGDGRDDILWRHTDGTISNWLATAAGGYVANDANAAAPVPNDWHVVGTGDFNGDGRDDILWRNNDGTLSNWLGQANGGFVANDANAAAPVPTAWHVAGVGDFNGDGRDDILWRNDDGQMSNWLGAANGGFTPNNANAAAVVPVAWQIIGTGDFNGDGRDDILWRNTDGTLSNWLGTAVGGYSANDANAAVFVPLAWSVVAIGDYNGDGRDDILWRHTDGTLSNWLGTAAGGYTPNDANAAAPVPTSWEVQPEPFLL